MGSDFSKYFNFPVNDHLFELRTIHIKIRRSKHQDTSNDSMAAVFRYPILHTLRVTAYYSFYNIKFLKCCESRHAMSFSIP